MLQSKFKINLKSLPESFRAILQKDSKPYDASKIDSLINDYDDIVDDL